MAVPLQNLASALTSLGIVIGTSAVIAMVSAGGSARQKLDERLANVGKNLILIRAGAHTHASFLDWRRRSRRAGFVGRLGPRPDSPVAKLEVGNHRSDDKRDVYIWTSPMKTHTVLFQVLDRAGDRGKAHRRASGKHEPVNGLDGAYGLEHHAKLRAGGGAVVVHAGGGLRVEQNRRASRRAARLCKMPDTDPWNVGDGAVAFRIGRERFRHCFGMTCPGPGH